MLTTLQSAELVSILTEFENMGAKGIAFIPIDDVQVIKKANQLAEDGVAIVTFNSKLKGIHDIRYVGQITSRRAAWLQVSWKACAEGGDIGVIISSKTLSCHPNRLDGFRSHLGKSNLNIVDIQENQDRRDLAFKIALEYCNNYPNLKGIYCQAAAATVVAEGFGIVRQTSRCQDISHDLVPENEELLKEGIVDFVIAQK